MRGFIAFLMILLTLPNKSRIDHLMKPLTHCFHLSILPLDVPFQNAMHGQRITTTLHGILSHISSPRIKKLQLTFNFRRYGAGIASLPKNLEHIHNTITRPLFDALLDVTLVLTLHNKSGSHCTVQDLIATRQELARQHRLVLRPWDERGILKITGQYGHISRADQKAPKKRRDIAPGNSSDEASGITLVRSDITLAVAGEDTGRSVRKGEMGRTLA